MYHTRPGSQGGMMGYGDKGGGKGAPLEGAGPSQAHEPDWTIKDQASEFEQENDYVQFFKYIQVKKQKLSIHLKKLPSLQRKIF